MSTFCLSYLDRVNIYGFLAFIFVWHLCVWTPIAHIVWNERGFYMKHGIRDFAGGIVVHMVAGITSLGKYNVYLHFTCVASKSVLLLQC
ncbi:ammonium transporter [archaeon]|nr:MAG: ammonium transporter [archaeon]